MNKGSEIYSSNLSKWRLYRAAYEGTKELIKIPGVFDKHERESDENYEKRVSQVYGFNFSRAIVEILTFYLFQVPFEPDWGFLTSNEEFKKFQKDCDFWGTGLETFLDTRQKQASIYGQIGILIDKPAADSPDAVPYLTYYTPENVIDWQYSRDELGRPYLSYIKLIDENQDEIEWTQDTWKRTAYASTERSAEGKNDLGEIPFVWLINIPSNDPHVGISDISEISNVDASIIRNLSQMEEISEYAAFPMLMKPESQPTDDDDDDVVGVTAVLEFDPAYPDSIPKWLESKAKEPIEAILNMIAEKKSAIYHSANAGGINATQVSQQARSGVALESEFQLLNAKLAVKSAYLEIAEWKIVEFWAKWQNIYTERDMGEININRPRSFNVTNLASDLEAVIMGTSFVSSDEFNRTMQRIVSRRMAGERGDYEVIDQEIDKNPIRVNEPMTRAEIVGDRTGAIDNSGSKEPGAQGDKDET